MGGIIKYNYNSKIDYEGVDQNNKDGLRLVFFASTIGFIIYTIERMTEIESEHFACLVGSV